MAGKGWYIVGIIFFLILLIVAGILVYWAVTRKNPTGIACTADNQCGTTQKCVDKFCKENTCTLNSDCGLQQFCSGGFCFQTECVDNKDCGANSGLICVNQLCTPHGQACKESRDCGSGLLSCIGGVCSQCAENKDCGNGICFQGICYNTCNGITGACGTGTCVNNSCCPDGNYPATCSSTADCGSGFCVNGSCTCKKGAYKSTCADNRDCESGICRGKFCLNPGNNCIHSFNPNMSGDSYCPAGTPYCSNGVCSVNPIDSPCECSGTGCSQSCNRIAGASFTYCVNGKCSLSPGFAGAVCTSSADCASISGLPSCTNGKCV